MAIRRSFRDRDLLEVTRCALRQTAPYGRSADEILAEEAARAIWIGVFNREKDEINLVPSYQEICGWVEKSKTNAEAAGVTSQRFSRFLNGPALTMVRHLHELLIRYSPCQPVTPYELSLSRANVSGEYAVVVDRRDLHLDTLFVLRIRTPAASHHPDVVNWLRWLHLKTFEGRNAPMVETLNFCCETGKEWREQVPNEKTIRPSLTALVESMICLANVPMPGDYCVSCLTDGCQVAGKAAV